MFYYFKTSIFVYKFYIFNNILERVINFDHTNILRIVF